MLKLLINTLFSNTDALNKKNTSGLNTLLLVGILLLSVHNYQAIQTLANSQERMKMVIFYKLGINVDEIRKYEDSARKEGLDGHAETKNQIGVP